MPGELIPSPEMTVPVPSTLDPTQRIQLWLDLMETCDQLLRAGLLHAVGPGGDLREAYRQWYEQEMVEHDQMIRRMAARLRDTQADAS